MTADLDLSPEAVQRLAKVCCETGSNYMTASQAPAVMRALAAENERLAVEIDRLAAALDEMTRRRNAWREKAAGHDDLRAAVRAGIEQAGERNLPRVFMRGALAESEQSLAEARAENARLRAERDAAYQRGRMNGATAMQKMAVSAIMAAGNKPGNRWISRQEALERVGGLPIPDKEGET